MSLTASEIATQPDVWQRALTERAGDAALLGSPGERVLYLGCGTSAFVAESIATLRERAGLGESDAAYASEWRPGRSYDRVVAISRSGTTSEVLAALTLVPSGTLTVGVTGVPASPLTEQVDEQLVLDFADEESVVQTRFPTTVLLLARAWFGEDVSQLADQARAALAVDLPLDVEEFDHFVYLGTGWTHGLAQEGALKIREAAQAWAEAYPMLDYRHGPIAVARSGSLVWIFGTPAPGLVADVEATGATVRTGSDDPLVSLVSAQRLAVQLAASRGLNPDTPRHLTRSVILS